MPLERRPYPIPNDDRKPAAGQKLVAGLIAAGLGALVLIGLVTGDISSTRHPELTRSSNPFFFWAYLVLFAATAVYSALLALGYVRPKAPPDYAARSRRQTVANFTFLALLGAAGAGWFWLTERQAGQNNMMTEIAGWIALAVLGPAAWPPHLAPGPAGAALRAAATAAIIWPSPWSSG
jgi:hypothetical protein